MSELLDIVVRDNGKGGHEDLRFQIHGLTDELVFDTYYFALAAEPLNTVVSVRECIAEYLEKWECSIERMNDGEVRILPIDLSDQYVGCLRAVEDGQRLRLDYGTCFVGGWAINVKEPEQDFSAVEGFGVGTTEPLITDKALFLRSLSRCSRQLRGFWND